MKHDNKYDFTIVGAGLSGLTLGIELLRQNYKVLMLEKSKNQQRPICGEYLTPMGVQIVNDLHLEKHLTPFEVLNGMILVSPSGKRVETFFPEGRKGISLDRKKFQEDLKNVFELYGGVILFNIEINSIQYAQDQCTLKTTQGEYKTQWLIGADGRQSQTAKLSHLPSELPKQKKVALHCYLRPKNKLPRLGQMHILPKGQYIGINPINEEEVNFSLVTDYSQLKKFSSAKDLLNFWIHHQSNLSNQFDLITDQEIKTISPITRSAKRIAGPRVALIGDASGFIDPLTGEGMTTALATAQMLSKEIKKNKNIQEAFYAYEKRRKQEFIQKEFFNHILQNIIQFKNVCEVIALCLESSFKLRSIFIGVIGNIYGPKEALKKLFLRTQS